MYLAKRNNTNFFDDFFKSPFLGAVEQVGGSRLMKTDVKEVEDAFEIIMDLPGVEKEDIQIELKEGYLTVSASKTTQFSESGENCRYIRKERFEGSAKRSFFVGDFANEDNIRASYNNGVLKLTIPKEPEPEPEQPKRINID
ncbi:MAG: Hsp20/alpha crystallin family protein [Lachnospiraceae bacterium]|jgi:HSP20 family molecular chaperone IbpA|nr:Hsp20/alpha crystallin family protein [Lachnospiraceae bacterium]MBR3263111.1 Hsp20/alpha crystallin family protein [Lachnospiraceae bacterium]